MNDAVALTSVASSALVALGGLFVTYRSGREQRAHEARLSYEERVWQEKSSALFQVISATRTLLDVLESTDPRVQERLSVTAPATRETLDRALPVVEAYASEECRSAFAALRATLRNVREDHVLAITVATVRRAKEEAIDAQDFPLAAQKRDEERGLFRLASERLDLDRPETITRAGRLLLAARESVRGAS